MNDNAIRSTLHEVTITVTFEPPVPSARPAYVACVRVGGRPALTIHARKRAVVEQRTRWWCSSLGLEPAWVRPGVQSPRPVWLEAASEADRVRFHRQLARLGSMRVGAARAA